MSDHDQFPDFARLQSLERELADTASRLYAEASSLAGVCSTAAAIASTMETVLNDPASIEDEAVRRVCRAQIASVRRMCAGSRFGPPSFREEPAP